MSDTLNLRKSIQSLEKSEQFDGYTKVVITVSEDMEYSAGDETGRTLTLTCPFGSQKLANDLLSKVRGFQYQPYTSSGAHIDPASEIGDGVTVGNVYSGVFKKNVFHGPLYTADISAPGGDKANYEYPYMSPQERIVKRNFKEVKSSLRIQASQIAAEVEDRQAEDNALRATLNVQAQQIEAKVSKDGGNSSSFGWKLTATGWSVYGNGSEIFRVDKNGAEVKGIIRATGGKIGGFDIQSNYLSYNGQTWGGTNSTGAYIGQSGIQLGKNFKVDMQGNLTAKSGTFLGSVNAGKIQYGGSAGYMSGGGISSGSISGNRLVANTVSTAYTSSGINTSLGYADYANEVLNGFARAVLIGVDSLFANRANVDRLRITFENQARTIGYNTITVDGKSYRVLTF